MEGELALLPEVAQAAAVVVGLIPDPGRVIRFGKWSRRKCNSSLILRSNSLFARKISLFLQKNSLFHGAGNLAGSH